MNSVLIFHSILIAFSSSVLLLVQKYISDRCEEHLTSVFF